MIYLASPYTCNPEGNYQLTRAFVAAYTLEHPYNLLFSPIVHYHPMAHKYNLPIEFSFWRQINGRGIQAAKSVLVLRAPEWKDSIGVKAEIEIAKRNFKTVEYTEEVIMGDMYEFSRLRQLARRLLLAHEI